MLTRVLLLAVGLVIGYLVHLSISSATYERLELQLQEKTKHAADLEQQLQTFKTHISELSNSGSLNSEEMLAKIMQIFLADLSLRLKPATVIADPPMPTTPVPRFKVEAQMPQEDPSKQVEATKTETRSEKISFNKEAEKRIANTRHEFEAIEALGKIRFENFFNVISETKPIDVKNSLVLEGNFSGTIQPLDSSQKIVSIRMEVNLRNDQDKPQGQVKIIESRDGKTFSRTSGSGALKNFSLYESSAMIIVEHNGGDNYFQLYYSASGDFFAGNDYKKVSVTNYTPSGTVILRRTH